jgi:WD40 repeat protein
VWDMRNLKQNGCVHQFHACEADSSSSSKASSKSASKAVLTGRPTCCSFDSSGRWLAVGNTDGTVRYWSLQVQRMSCTLPVDSIPLCMATQSNDLWIGCASGSLYGGGFLSRSIESFQKIVVPGRPAVLGVVGLQSQEALSGAVYACGAPGTIHALNTLGRTAMGTIISNM